MKKVYFLSDAHLGSRAIPHSRELEKKLCRFLDSIRDEAGAIYMLGDMFDFWHEYPTVVPKGFTRFLGKLSEMTDAGVQIHYFIGNHDIWAYNYLEEECGVILHRQPQQVKLQDGVRLYLAHGDGLGDVNHGFRFVRSIFHNRVCQFLFRWIHPTIGMCFGLEWARRSRLKHEGKVLMSNQFGDNMYQGYQPGQLDANPFLGEDQEPLVLFAKDYLKSHPDTSAFVFGHRHIELELMLSRTTQMFVLGDWISKFTYLVWDGENFEMKNYEE